MEPLRILQKGRPVKTRTNRNRKQTQGKILLEFLGQVGTLEGLSLYGHTGRTNALGMIVMDEPTPDVFIHVEQIFTGWIKDAQEGQFGYPESLRLLIKVPGRTDYASLEFTNFLEVVQQHPDLPLREWVVRLADAGSVRMGVN